MYIFSELSLRKMFYFVLSCALGQVWWTDNHSCSNCDLFAYMSWMRKKLACSCQSINLLTETFGSSLIQNGLNFSSFIVSVADMSVSQWRVNHGVASDADFAFYFLNYEEALEEGGLEVLGQLVMRL